MRTVVVGASSRIRSLDADTVRDLFLRRRTLLSDGARAVPINLPVGSGVRERFSVLVLGRKPADLSAYWDRLYFDATNFSWFAVFYPGGQMRIGMLG